MKTPESDRRLSILHVILALTPTNCQYNEHCLPMMNEREITIATYFRSIWGITPPAGIALFDGDGTLRGFFRTLRIALEARAYDVIHVHTPHAGVLVPMALLCYGLYRRLKPSTVHTVHNSFRSFKLRHKLMLMPGMAFFQRVVFCSKAAYESFPSLYKQLAGGRASIVQNGVDIERIDRVTRTQQVDRNGHFTVAAVGLIKIKGPFTVLEAFRQCADPASRVVFMGEGHLRPLLAAEAEESGLQEQVQLTGLIPRDSVFEQLAQADLFISASRGEGLPVAVLEAMACSCPVLLSDIPPHREIAEGVDWIPLVQPDDVTGFAREIARFRDMSPEQRAGIGRKCRERVEERFSLRAMHAGYMQVYAQIANGRVPLSKDTR
jgi:glycosyltransferase involved in cell wall biosynthesis